MKKLIIIFSLIVGGFASCSILDVDIPDNLIKDEYWQTKDQVEASLAGVYTSLNSSITQFIKWGDLRSEIYTIGTNEIASDDQLISQDIFTDNANANWAQVYKSINWANSFLKNARSTMDKDPSITEEEMLAWESEAYAVRALYYFYLVRTFKDVPLVLEAFESDGQDAYRSVASEKIILDTIQSDLERALIGARTSFSNPYENYGKITKNAVRAILADVRLWAGDYEGCVALCEELEAEYTNRMIAPAEWFTIFSQGNSSESIFEYQYLSTEGVKSPLYGLTYPADKTPLSANVGIIHERILSLYPPSSDEQQYGDTVRRATFFTEIIKYTVSDPYAIPTVYRGVDSRDANFIFYRFKEILLMKAEALGMMERYNDGSDVINKFRQTAGLPILNDASEFGAGLMFFENLLDERIGELAFEGKHWFSQVRMARNSGYEELVIERIVSSARHTSPNLSQQTMRARMLDQESWFLPYLESEVETNPLLEQKDFYEGK